MVSPSKTQPVHAAVEQCSAKESECGDSIHMHGLQFLEGWSYHEAKIHHAQESLSLSSSLHEAHFLDLKSEFLVSHVTI